MELDKNKCPFCANDVISVKEPPNIDEYKYECPTCKTFTIDVSLILEYGLFLWDNPKKAMAVSHAVCKMNMREKFPRVTEELLERLIKNPVMPTPPEQADNLLLWLGDTTLGPGQYVTLSPREHQAIAGCPTDDVFSCNVESASR